MANNYKRWLCEESLKTPSSRPILIYLEFRSKPTLITVICMNPHLPNKFQFVATKYYFFILREDTSFFFLIIYIIIFRFFCYFTLLLIFTKIILLLLFYYIFFFMKYFSCSGMSRNVPGCSMFLVLSTPDRLTWVPLPNRVSRRLLRDTYFYRVKKLFSSTAIVWY